MLSNKFRTVAWNMSNSNILDTVGRYAGPW
jgi:hypothetical protein